MGPGWYLATDGRWYPPAAPSAGGALRGTLAGGPAGGRPADAGPPRAQGHIPSGAIGHSVPVVAGPLDDPDRFRLLRLQSRGGEGELWQGEILIDRVAIPVAVKVIHPSNAANIVEWRARWQRQAELLRSLDHPGLVKVRDVFEGPVPHPPGAIDPSTRSLYLVMNWVQGQTLEQWVGTYPNRTFTDAIRLVERLASAVDHLHTGGLGGWPIVHRDIKPANVIINGSKACLVDFGFARILSDQPMTLVGTPSYLAPEVLSRGMYSEASDRFALGGTAFFTLTGRRPDPDDPAAMAAALCGVPGVEGRDDVAAAFMVMLSPDPYQRPRNATAWVHSVVAVAGGERPALAPPAPPLTAAHVMYAPAPSAGSPPRLPPVPNSPVAPALTAPTSGRSDGRGFKIALYCIGFAILACLGILLGIGLMRFL